MFGHPALEIGRTCGAQRRYHSGFSDTGLRITGEDDQAVSETCGHTFFPAVVLALMATI
jgi:hypothetical protein